MKIKADKEGTQIIGQLLDLALKTGGLSNLETVKNIMENLEQISEVDECQKDSNQHP